MTNKTEAGLERKSQNRTENIEEMTSYLDKGRYEKLRYTQIAEFFSDIGGRLLDVGCCRGDLRNYLCKGIFYVGIDSGANIINDFQFITCDLNKKKLPFKDKSFDAISCTGLLEHLLYPLEILQECKRILKDNGVILISLPNDRSIQSVLDNFLVQRDYEESLFSHHWKFNIDSARKFTRRELEIIRESAHLGFKGEHLPTFLKRIFGKIPFFIAEWFMLCRKKRE